VIRYTDDMAAITGVMLTGFFVGWPKAPSVQQHLAVLRGSFRSIVAIDDDTGRAVGFVNMISDGVLTAFIPWLEVLPEYQGRGIGTALMRQVLGTDGLYSVDLVCDGPLLPYYEKLGMTAIPGAGLRNGRALRGPVA
jgi:ribosomal protein S18 acetylase RimI-like enzyme